jgi:glycosyltransferase involved in cell wall biosynthesis
MGSVLRLIRDHSIGGDSVSLDPTWDAGSQLRSATLTLHAAGVVMRMSPDEIAHVHLSERGSFMREGALLALAKRRGLKTVATIHGASFTSFAQRRARFAAAVLSCADLVTCLDPDVDGLVGELAPETRVVLLPNPVALPEAIVPVDQTAEVVLFAGEIGLRKGVDVLCRAWEKVARERPAARCILVGPATDLKPPQLERLEIRPPAGSGEMSDLLACARVVALPSRAEGMPMTLVEAMAAGRPFISTPVGGIPQLAAGDGGMLVPVGDAAGLALRLVEFLTSPGMARTWGERGRSFCAKTRSIEVIDGQLRELYGAIRSAAG